MKKYIITDTLEKVSERDLRKMLFKYEYEDIGNNEKDYFEGNILDLKSQFNCMNKALNGDMKEVLYALETSWNVPVTLIEDEENWDFEDLNEISSYCEQLITENKIENYYIIFNVEDLRVILNELFEHTLGTGHFIGTEIRTRKCNDKNVYIISNKYISFDNIEI